MKTVRIGRFQFQKKTKQEWLDSKVTLLDGELALESETSKIKIGDGSSPYLDLPYVKIGEIGLKDLTDEEKESLKGEPFKYEDFTKEQLQALKGEKGDVDWNNITEEQKSALIEALDIKDIDLSNYAKKDDLEKYPTTDYLNTIVSDSHMGILQEVNNINNDISEMYKYVRDKEDEDTTYTAGSGLSLSGTTFNLVNAKDSSNLKIWVGSKAEYEGISYKQSDTLYMVKE